MVAFKEWLLAEEREIIDRDVVQGYERTFQDGLDKLIQRTKDPVLRSTFKRMRSCPIRTGSGCSLFTDYILGALIRHNCHRRYDLDQALNYIVFRLLSPVGESGKPKGTLWDFDETRPYAPGDNPLEARFKTFVGHDIKSVCAGRIGRLRSLDRPAGTVSITQGRRNDEAPGEVGAHEIPGRSTTSEDEMLGDIMDLLRQKSTSNLPLAAFFMGMLKGETVRQQQKTFGFTTANNTRNAVMQTLRDYATSTENWQLLNLLDKLRDAALARHDPNRPRPVRPIRQPKPKLPPDEQDYRSIVQVVERMGQRATMAHFGSARSSWLGRKPRNPDSPHPTRLHDVLARMVADQVLAKQGSAYVPGPKYQAYLDAKPLPQAG